MTYATNLASCIWKALGFVPRLIHTDYAKNYIAGHRKTGPKGRPAWGAGRPHWKNRGIWAPQPLGLQRLWISQTPSHRLVRSQYRGIVCAKEEESWQDLEICVSWKVGGAETSFCPPPCLQSGGEEHPLAPPVPTPMEQTIFSSLFAEQFFFSLEKNIALPPRIILSAPKIHGQPFICCSGNTCYITVAFIR